MRDKKDQEETLEQFIQKHSIRKEEVSKAPPPITPLSGYGATLPRPPKTDPPKEPFKRITGTDLMKRWSVGWEAIFHFAEQENLIPDKPEPEDLRRRVKYDFGMLSDYSPKEREEYFSKWLYHPNGVEAFEAQHGNILDDWRKEVASSEPQASGTTRGKRQQQESRLTKEETKEVLKNLALSSTNPLEFEIVLPGRKKIVNPNALGCRDANTDEWNALIDITRDPDHKFNLNHGKSTPEARRKLRDKINEKLVAYFQKHMNIDLPEEYKFFEQNKDEDGPGVFRFNFGRTIAEVQTKEEKRASDLTNEDLLNRLETLNKCAGSDDSRENEEYVALVGVAIKRGIPVEEIKKRCKQGQVRYEMKGGDETADAWERITDKATRIEALAQEEESEQ